ncbi:MAG: cytochrome c oxidase subunit II [Verrucomicrobia bacterium]|nr:cytochrome c oxidase subunit II [Verrucomicrobiota bacterium]
MIERYLVQASSYAADIDNLFNLINLIVGVWFVIAEGVLLYLIIRFRRKEGVKAAYITGEEKSQKKWITYPHILVILCDVVLIYGTMVVWNKVKVTLPEAEETVRVISQQWAWTFVQPGPDGKLDTEDDIATVDELHIREGTIYHFELESKDVVHSFSIPVFRLKQDAVPGRTITGWFEAIKTGEYDIQCAEMCGIGHGLMPARIFIESKDDHSKWMASQENNKSAASIALAK